MDIMSETIQHEFYNGFIEALKWSTGGEAALECAPEGYLTRTVDELGPGWEFVLCGEGGEPLAFGESSDSFTTKREAIEAAWKDKGEEPPTLESLEDFDLSDKADVILRAICRTFCHLHFDLLHRYAREMDGKTSGCGTVWEHAGHDFWLTLAGHGAGFWGDGLDDLGESLTTACEPFEHKIEPYIGDDGLIHV